MKRDAKKLAEIVLYALTLAILFDYLFFDGYLGISFPLFIALTLAAVFLAATRFSIELSWEARILALLAFAISLLAPLRTSAVLVTLNTILACYLLLLLYGNLAGLSIRQFTLEGYIRQILGTGTQVFAESGLAYRDLSKESSAFYENQSLHQVLKGVLLSIPLIAIMAWLLASADLVFDKYLSNLIDYLLSTDILSHFFILAPMFVILTGLFTYGFYRLLRDRQAELLELSLAERIVRAGVIKTLLVLAVVNFICAPLLLGSIDVLYGGGSRPLAIGGIIVFSLVFASFALCLYFFYRYRLQYGDDGTELVVTKTRSLSPIESSVILGSVALLMSFFVGVQFTYFFGGSSNITAQGFSYAEYAHRGFFELVAVSLIIFVLIWITSQRTIKTARWPVVLLKSLFTLLISLVLVIMVSAFQRLSIYEAAYGYTVLRFYTQAFIVALGMLFLLLLFKLLAGRSEEWFCLRAISLALIVAIALSTASPDRIIARFNLERYAATQKTDLLIYNTELSNDAIDQLVMGDSKPTDKTTAQLLRSDLRQRLEQLRKMPWQGRGTAQQHALQALQQWEDETNGKTASAR